MAEKAEGGVNPPSHADGRSFSEAELLRVTLSSIGDGVITTDALGKVTFLNPVAQTLTGWTQERALGHDLTEVFRIVNQDTRAEVQNPALRALKEGVIVGLANHTILIAGDGTERNIDDSAAPIRDRDGTVGGAVLVFRDITERYKQERTIAESLAYANAILATMRNGLMVLDTDLRIKTANTSFYKMFKVTEQDTLGRPIYELGNGHWDIPRLRALLQRILPDDGTMEDFEVERDFERIGPRVMLLNARRLRNHVPDNELILLVFEDVTEKRAAEQAVRDSEERYRRLFESAEDGILILDHDEGKVIDANPYVLKMIGLDLGGLRGKEMWGIGLFQNADESKKAHTELKNKGYVRYDHLPVQHRNGHTTPAEFVCNVYKEGQRTVAQCNVRDISLRAQLDKANVRAEVMAEEARRKDEFLAMLSHELRNPLAPIRAAVHLLRTRERAGNEDLVQKQAHEIIERQVANLTKIVSDLLEVSRVLAGRIRLNTQVVDMNQVVRHAAETTQPLFEQRKHTFSLNLSDDGMWVNGDPTRLEEIFVNLLNNAAKYTPDGGRIGVRCEHTPGSNNVRVRVRDNGVGIPAKLLPRVFDLFTQDERSLDRAAGGLGIGLSLAQRLVELHGGTIEAHSPPDESDEDMGGSEFIVMLPLVPPPLAARSTGFESSPVNPEGTRVLLVDDNIDMVMMLSSSLREKGYSVQAAYTGPDGLKVAQQWRPDVVVLDIGLPGMDGYEVARRLRADSQLGSAGRTMRLIALTGYGRETDLAQARAASFDGHLTKPVEFNDLEKMMTAPQV